MWTCTLYDRWLEGICGADMASSAAEGGGQAPPVLTAAGASPSVGARPQEPTKARRNASTTWCSE